MNVWVSMGFIRYPMAVTCVIILAVTLWCTVRLFGSGARADLQTKAWVDAILFWGGFALMTGVLGTLVGVILAASSIEQAGTVHATLVWGGMKVAILSSVFGLLIIAVASLAWFGLQMRWRLMQASAAS